MSGSGGSSSKNIQQHLSEIETKAYANARIRCSELFSQPESLNEIETIKRKVKQERDKNDKKLKQSIQSQLEGVSLALNKLQNISHQSSLLSKDNEVLYSSLKQILAMSKQLKGLRETNKVHQQLKSIIQNFEYIFNMNDLIKKGFLYLNNERPNLLGAHDIYMKLNGARDTLLLEVHKQSSDQNSQPNSIISNYFAPTNDLFNGIESKIHTVIKTLTNIVKDDPKIIVSCFRIIEREEKLDEYAAGLQKRFNFMPPHRPRNMRIKAFEKIEACLHYR
ncbi:MAG: Exocyst complex component 3 [Paramarteilia canceri]